MYHPVGRETPTVVWYFCVLGWEGSIVLQLSCRCTVDHVRIWRAFDVWSRQFLATSSSLSFANKGPSFSWLSGPFVDTERLVVIHRELPREWVKARKSPPSSNVSPDRKRRVLIIINKHNSPMRLFLWYYARAPLLFFCVSRWGCDY